MISRMVTSKNFNAIYLCYLFIIATGFYFILLIFTYIISVFKSIFFQTSIEEELNKDFHDFPWTNSKNMTSPRKRTITIDNSNETDEFIQPANINVKY